MPGTIKTRPGPIPYWKLSEVISEYGMTMASADNAIRADRFPVRTYRVGRFRVVDKQVHAAWVKMRQEFFEHERIEGLKLLKKGKK